MLEIGTLLDGKYRILSEIGRGGMSVIYLAMNERANRTWAVKELKKDGKMEEAAVRQGLIMETDLLKKLRHPNLPGIVDVIDTPESLLIVMDYTEGISLQKLLRQRGALPEEPVIRWGRQLCAVLDYLHHQNPPIIYRDMKPSNVMLRPDGNVVLIDFGTARELKDCHMTEDTICLGTRGYAAPEQFGGRGQTDVRTDIYCLGATLYHLLTGHSPAEPPYEIKPLRYWKESWKNTGLEKLILKCTRMDPGARYQNCGELMQALLHYREEDEAAKRTRRRKWRAFLAGVVTGCLGLAGCVGFGTAAGSARQASYEYLIAQAEAQNSIEEAETWFRQAMEVNAGDRAVYEALLNKAQEDMLSKNGRMSAETASLVKRCLNSSSGGTRSSLLQLADQDPEEYAKVLYETGIWHFFLMDNTDGNRKAAADHYFTRILEEDMLQYLPERQQELTRILSRIGSCLGNLNDALSKYGTERGGAFSYRMLFADLSEIVSADLSENLEKEIYCVDILQQIAVWLDTRAEDFRADGVSSGQMEELMSRILQQLNRLAVTKESRIYGEYAAAVETVRTAARNIGMERKTEEENG